jgi:preprotein translocase subunit SecF
MKVINFMGHRKGAMLLSVTLLLVSIGSLATRQLNWGLDFTGGTLVEVHYSETADLNAIRDTLDTEGHSGATVVSFGSDRDVMIRLPKGYSDKQGAQLLGKLQESFSSQTSSGETSAGRVELRRMEFVGPQVGDELREQGGLAMLLALGLVMLYIAFRFQLKFAFGAVVALVHDVILTLGFFSITGMEFNLTTLAALLAVIGYSLNDTIVVFDRIRENRGKSRALTAQVITNSINQTISRTIMTSVTTFIVVLIMYIFGGSGLRGFTFAIGLGIIVGTYSSIAIAAPILLLGTKNTKSKKR